MRKYILELSLAFGLVAALLSCAFANDKQEDLSNKLIRLHVVANSDSKEDQALKLKVRDRVLDAVSELTAGAEDVGQSRAIIEKNLELLTELANDEIAKNGFAYHASAELSKVYFPTREYDSFSLPAGDYEALRIIIGDGAGKNWWCVLFPPLCVSASEAEVTEAAENAGLSGDEISLITSDEVEYKFKFKLIELVGELMHAF